MEDGKGHNGGMAAPKTHGPDINYVITSLNHETYIRRSNILSNVNAAGKGMSNKNTTKFLVSIRCLLVGSYHL